MGLVLNGVVAGWLRRLGVVRDSELSPYGDSIALTREAACEFETGIRVGRLLQVLPGAKLRKLATLKDLNTPVAKLFNWNLLLPELRDRGVQVDADMKVLIVAGDTDIVIDLLRQLHAATSADAVGSGASAARSDPRRADYLGDEPVPAVDKPTDARSAQEYFAVCLQLQLHCSWAEAAELLRSSGPRRLSTKLMHGVNGSFDPVVRYLKLAFAHCRHLAGLCERDGAACELALGTLRDGLCSTSADVALWTSRLLCRLASELTARGEQEALWPWFSRPAGGTSALTEAWRAHPELHAAGALLPLVLHFSGDHLGTFLSAVLPQHLPTPRLFFAFAAELIPLLSATKGMHAYMAESGGLEYLLQRALHVARQPQAPAQARGHTLDLLASLWLHFSDEVQAIPLELLDGAAARADEAETPPTDAASIVLSELKRGCRDTDFELQLTAHMALFRLLDQFASAGHAAAPVLFKVLAFSLIENHHEPVMRHFLARNMQHTLAQQPQIPVSVLLKPLIKQATLYGYGNCDFDFFLVLAKHPRLSLRHALLLIQFLGKVCLNDALHGRVGSIPFLVLIERFHDSEVLLDFLEVFCEQALGKLVPDGVGVKSAIESSTIRATLCIELVAKLLHLPHAQLLQRVAPTVVRAHELYQAHRSAEHPGLAALIRFTQRNPVSPSLKLPFKPAPDAVATFITQQDTSPGRRKQSHKLPAIEPKPAPVSDDEAFDIDAAFPPAAAKLVAGGAGGSYARAKAARTGRPAGIGRVARKGGAEGAGAEAPRKLRAGGEDERQKSREERLKGSLGKSDDGRLKPAKPAGSAEANPAKPKEGEYAKPSKPAARAGTGGKAGPSKAGDESRGRRTTRAASGPTSAGDQARAALEKALNAAEDPNSIVIPAGLTVKVERRERLMHVVPPQLGLGEAVSTVLEVLDGIVSKAVGVHILHAVTAEETVLRVVPEGAAAKAGQERKRVGAGAVGSVGGRAARAARASASPVPASVRRDARATTAPQAKSDAHAKTMPRPKLVPAEGKPAERSKSEPRTRPRPPAEPVRERKVAAPPSKPPPLKPRPKPPALPLMIQTLGGPAKETLLLRAEVRKQVEEEERMKKERERDARMEKRRKETHAKLLEYQGRKQQKEEEKEAKAEAAALAQKEEERKQREKEKRRQAKQKQKLIEYRKTATAVSAFLVGAAPVPGQDSKSPAQPKPFDGPDSQSTASATAAPLPAASVTEVAAAPAPAASKPEAGSPAPEVEVEAAVPAAELEPAAANVGVMGGGEGAGAHQPDTASVEATKADDVEAADGGEETAAQEPATAANVGAMDDTPEAGGGVEPGGDEEPGATEEV
jgi:hypothetical protein